jgi:hypothetical protein
MYYTPGFDDVSSITIYKPLGSTSGGVASSTMAVSWIESFYLKPLTLDSCNALFSQSNFTSRGKRNGVTWFGATLLVRSEFDSAIETAGKSSAASVHHGIV